jgi:oxygen-dependent protoporphyrinogen oxidase
VAGRVVVVGAGIAGLAAADRLVARGFDVTVLERGEQPGGRAESCVEKSFRYEPGAHLVSDADSRLLRLVEEAQLGPELLPLRPVELAQVGRGRARRLDATSIKGLHDTLGLPWRSALRTARIERLLGRFGSRLDPEAPEGALGQDDRSVADFVRLYFGRRALESWIAPWIAEHAGAEADATSRVLALQLLARHRHPWWGTFRGDLARLPEALAGRVGVRTHEEVLGVEPGAAWGLVVHHRRAGSEEATDAEAVVMALPARPTASLTSDLLSGAEAELLGSAREIPAVSLAVGLDSYLADHSTRVRIAPGAGSLVTSVSLELGYETVRVPERQGLAVMVAAGATELLEISDENVAARLVGDLERFFPSAAARVTWTRVHRHAAAWPAFDVGRYRALARLTGIGLDRRAHGRRLYLAGDHCIAPSLEGAVVSGLRAADAICQDFGSP